MNVNWNSLITLHSFLAARLHKVKKKLKKKWSVKYKGLNFPPLGPDFCCFHVVKHSLCIQGVESLITSPE